MLARDPFTAKANEKGKTDILTAQIFRVPAPPAQPVAQATQ